MEKHQLFSLKKTEEKQLLLIMKFFSFFLLIGRGHCLATNSYSQSKLFTMKTSQKTVKQVFQEIEKNSEYIIFYMDQIIDTNRKVNIDVKNQQVSAILDQLFLGTDNTYSINDRQISIYHNGEQPNSQQQSNKFTVTGVISDAQGESMIGVSVKVKGTKEVVEIKIDAENLEKDDIEMLQDLVLSAVNEALRKVDDMQQSQMSKVTGGMNIPGLF